MDSSCYASSTKLKQCLKLFDAVKESPVRETFFIHVDRQSARPKKSKQKARPKRAGRRAQVSLRYQPVEIRPPADQKDKAPVALWIVHVIEDNPPEGVEIGRAHV